MTEKNLEKFKEIAYDYYRLVYIDSIHKHCIEVKDEFENNSVQIKLSDIYKQKYELFRKILEDEGYSDEDIQKLEDEKEFKYYYALCFESKHITNMVTLIPFLSEEQRQQFMEEDNPFFEKIIPIDPNIFLDNNKE